MRYAPTLEQLSNPFFMEAMRKQDIYEAVRDDWRASHPFVAKEEIGRGEKQRQKDRLQDT